MYVIWTPEPSHGEKEVARASANPVAKDVPTLGRNSESQVMPEAGQPVSTHAAVSRRDPITPQAIPSASIGEAEQTAIPFREDAVASQEAVRAMNSMIMAHISLRAPEETDPDSRTNKEIMQVMIVKALSSGPNPRSEPQN
jgi:hypothetical protein